MNCTWQLALLFLSVLGASGGPYEPTWDSLDGRPLPDWYDRAKVGIFIHWGVFSVPSFGSEWFWEFWQGMKFTKFTEFMESNFRPNFTYPDFAHRFTAEFYDPSEWASIFNASGARYVVLTSKHHEGFTMWPSKHAWNWNSVDVGPKRDLVGDLANAIRTKAPHIHFGLYHSLFEWFNPLYHQDKANKFTTQDYVMSKALPELYELVHSYEPEIIWSDGDADGSDDYWKSKEFLAWLFNESPVRDDVVVNDRWGKGMSCHHGSFYTCHDRYNPGVLQSHKWENAMTLDKKSWGYRREAPVGDYLTINDLITTLAETISCGGNLLVNVGPTHDGRIPPIMEERLRQFGSWLDINGEAVYNSVPWKHQNDTLTPGVWYTSNADLVYGIVLTWPTKNLLRLGAINSAEDVKLLGYDNSGSGHLTLSASRGGILVSFPPMSEVSSQWAWVLVFAGATPA